MDEGRVLTSGFGEDRSRELILRDTRNLSRYIMNAQGHVYVHCSVVNYTHRTHVTNSEGYLINMNQLLYRSVSDPFYFDTDPDLRIRFR